MDRKIIKNYLYNSLYQFLIIAIPVITTPYISRVLSVYEYGLYNYTLTIMTYFSLIAALGFQIYGQKEIALANSDCERERKYSEIITLKLLVGIIISIIYYIFVIMFLPNKTVYILQGIGLIAVSFDLSWYYAGKENFKKLTYRNILIKIVSVLLLFLFVRGDNALLKYVISIAIPNFLGNLLLIIGIDVKYRVPKFEVSVVKKMIVTSAILFLPQLLQQLYSVIDITLLGQLSNKYEVGLYSQIFKIINMISVIICSIGTVLLPRIIVEYTSKNYKIVRDMLSQALSIIIHLSFPIMLGIISIVDIFVLCFFGEQYLGLIQLFPIAVILVLFLSCNNLLGTQLLIGTNNEKRLLVRIVICSIINIVLDCVLIPNMKSAGAIVATVISEFLFLLLSISFCKKTIGGKIIDLENIKPIGASIIMFFLLRVLKKIDMFDDLIQMIVMILIGVIVYVVLLLAFKDRFAMLCIREIKKYLNHKCQ